MGRAQPDIWHELQRLWVAVSAAHSAMVSEEEDGELETILRTWTVSLARFTRNIVAAVPYNQQRALSAAVHPCAPESID
ncbi:uncharacterized protein PHACADRAFT_263736 [Phanerochaete carnosa HHB-10118-sp]|uniref:Uncharacterized protein n=1 Tax=Phanerochaete carnosa (strain HHB-10118-sp) TaxID=650164 RepID=K5ULB6_PHACS|nr:uncharacterized protein PHACADRAFT_263736 [Phanerochaete carnosa HHB-10118-sp]EKM50441.1 hypothetical protein PHACADRAFT_263736 [Phanerochaete carnosa HHB-10118-sp]